MRSEMNLKGECNVVDTGNWKVFPD